MKPRSKYPLEKKYLWTRWVSDLQRQFFLQSVIIWMAQHVMSLDIFLSSADTHNSVKIKSSVILQSFQ